MPGNGKVFVSHAHEDNERCAPLLAALDAWGVDYWFDTQRMDAGHDLLASVQKAIADRDIFIRVGTKAALNSYWMKQELSAFMGLEAIDHREGHANRRVLIPLKLDAEYRFQPVELGRLYIDTSEQDQRSWIDQLRKALELIISSAHAGETQVNALRFGDIVALRAWNSKYVTADLNAEERLYATAPHTLEWEHFEIRSAFDPVPSSPVRSVSHGDGIAFRAMNNRKFVGAALSADKALTASVSWVRGWETFVLVRPVFSLCPEIGTTVGYGSCFALMAANGHYVSCKIDGNGELSATASRLQEWEIFTFQRAS